MAKDLQTYTVLDNLDYNHTRYAPGKTVQLDDETAAELLRLGVVEKVKAEKK